MWSHRTAEDSAQTGRWSHRPAEESHREAGGITEQLKRFTERQVESKNSWRESQRGRWSHKIS